MKFFLRFFSIVFLYNSHLLFANNSEKEIKSEITEVSIFLNGGMVTRSSNTTIPAGYTMLIFRGVSSKISKQTIKAEISNSVKVLSVEYLKKSITKGRQDSLKIKSLKDSIASIAKEIRKIDYQTAVYESEKQAIDQIKCYVLIL